uniref:Elongation of very long chain fatty acids protein n=1 Tax=Megaselia scalaris TaxID=36166 RepID=T1H4W6_MEGSC
MEHRKPYKLKTFMVVYNLYQLAACFVLIKLILEDEEVPMNRIFSKCLPVKSLNSSPALYFVTSFAYWLKVSEMCETFVFILRKKYNQVSFLHVFHHCATVTLISWEDILVI